MGSVGEELGPKNETVPELQHGSERGWCVLRECGITTKF